MKNIFWSWQNDYEPKVNRHFIREALMTATEMAAEELGLEDRPEVDHDTKGVPGMADIAATILNKITESAVFVADVTPIGKTAAGKALPNPNVLVELGWAMGKIGTERVICVLNTASGCKADDLPFDIRHRRMMTYELGTGADKPARIAAKKLLSSALFEALRDNLKLHVSAVSAAKEIVGVPANSADPSLWATSTDRLIYTDPFGDGTKNSHPFPARPRAYIRIIPSGWKSGPPSVHDIQNPGDLLILWPASGGSIDFGPTAEGFVRVSLAGGMDPPSASVLDVVMYFDATGEFWAVQGSAVGLANRGASLRHEAVIKHWADAIKTTYAVFQKFGGSADWRIEVGLVGMEDVRWYGQWNADSPVARKPSINIQRQFHGWEPAALTALLSDAYAAIRNMFGLRVATPDDVKKLLPPDWEEPARKRGQ